MQQDIKYFIIGQLVEQNTLMGIELQKVAAAKKDADEAKAKVAEVKEDRVAQQRAKNRPASQGADGRLSCPRPDRERDDANDGRRAGA